jgi:hypothetical protein
VNIFMPQCAVRTCSGTEALVISAPQKQRAIPSVRWSATQALVVHAVFPGVEVAVLAPQLEVPLGAGRRKPIPRLLEPGPRRKHAVVAARIDSASIKTPV